MDDGLASLSDRDLEAVASALRAGRLAPPFTSVALRRSLPESAALAVSATLATLSVEGFTAGHIATAIELVRRDRQSRPASDIGIDLVVTSPTAGGPMARDTRVVVRELFAQATRSVLVVGYAVHQGKQIFQALADRMDELPELQVDLFLDVKRPWGDTTRTTDLLGRFTADFWANQWPVHRPRPKLYYFPASLQESDQRSSLHAKCVVVDGATVLISSASFTTAAQQRNIELGVLIRSLEYAGQVQRHFQSLARAGSLLPL